MTEVIDNQIKYENYKALFNRLAVAQKHGFHLEAISIEYAIMEDRTESILRHANRWEAYIKSRKNHGSTLESKIKYIKKGAENKKDVAHKYFSDSLLDDVLAWKNDRNALVHALLKQQLSEERIEAFDTKGDVLAKALRTRVGSYTRMLARIEQKSEY